MTQVAASRSSRNASIKVWLTTAAALGLFGAGVVFGP